MKMLLLSATLLFGYSGYASTIDCLTKSGSLAYEIEVDKSGKVTKLDGIYDLGFERGLLTSGLFTEVRYKKQDDKHVVTGLIGPNEHFILAFNQNSDGMNGFVEFKESDLQGFPLKCEESGL